MRRNKKNFLYLTIMIIAISLALGYALLSTELKITGTTNISSATWNVYWDNIVLGSNNVTDVTTEATIQTGATEVNFNVNFKEPGDTYEFTVDAVNDGSIDAMIDVITKGVYAINGTTPKELPDYLEYSVTYSDGVEIASNHLLSAGSTETYKVRVHYKEDIEVTDLPSTADNYVFKIGVTYAQADDSATTRPVPSFGDDSWETIISNVQNNTIPSYYTVGSTKTVELGNSLGTHTLRIANTSTPAECGAEGFSQTACGFVLEFADIITTHRMNPYTSGDANLDGSTVNGTGNKGGWEYSDMRAFINSTTYANESIDYSTNGIYSSLPEVLRNAIIDTRVVSGHGSVDTTNYTTTDKLYLLSRREVWNNANTYDTASEQTRQIDYYASKGVTTSSYSGAIKQLNGSNYRWWLRSASSASASRFSGVNSTGSYNNINSINTNGVAPAFRIG